MAEINTGLGWAAQDTWLTQAGNLTVATLRQAGGPSFVGQPIPYATSPQEAVAMGEYYCYTGLYFNNPRYEWYAYTETEGAEIFIANVNNALFAMSPTQGARVSTARKDLSSGDITRYTTNQTTGYDATTGLYHIQLATQGNIYAEHANPNLLFCQTTREALDALEISETTFTKTNPGYAVTCVAKWKTQANVTISTPILISTDSSFTDMTDSSGRYNLAKLNILRQGVRFYMSFFDITDGDPQTAFPVLDLSGPEELPKSLEQVFAYIADLEHAAILVLDSPDPYEQETDASGEEGGDGEELEDDPVEEETLPLPSVAGHGFCTIYVPSSQELNQMASYLWGGSFDVSQVIKLFSNPMDSILGLSAVPVDLVGSPEQIYLGGVALTGITMPKYTGRTSVKVDFGSVTVAGRWGSYLDYAPYTDFSIYLPFIGIKPVKADDIMGKTVNLTYAIDILSGGCVAYLRPAGGSVLYEWSGQCALQIPVTGRSYDNVFQSAMSVATAAFAAVTAPASAPVLSGAVASAAVQAAATKPHIERSGTVNGITGFLGQLRPYLIRTIPEAYIPADQNKFIGYPAYINIDLGSVVGYNEVDSIHLENVTATGAELDEIETILKGGVIF